jgi:hypothetical protein
MDIWAKYGTATSTATGLNLVRIPHIKFGSTWANFAQSSHWTPNSSDVKLSKDGGALASIATNPNYVNGLWQYKFSSAELAAKVVAVRIVDEATKGILDDFISIKTYGHSSAFWAVNFGDIVRAGLTALPNVVAGASSGLPLAGDNAGRIKGVAGTKQTLDALNDIPSSAVSNAVSSQVIVYRLDHLLSAVAGSSEAVIGSIIASIVASGSSGRWQDFLSSSHALQALRAKQVSASSVAIAVWAQPTRALTDKSGFALSTANQDAISNNIWANSTRTLTDKAGFSLTLAERANIWGHSSRALTDKSNFALSTAARDALWRDTRIAAPSSHITIPATPEKAVGWLTALNLDRVENNSSQMFLYKHAASSITVAKAILAFSTSTARASRAEWTS